MSPAQLIVLVGTVMTGLATCLTAYAAVRRAKGEERSVAEVECLERLRAARMEGDADATELYRLRREQREREA